MVSDVAPIHPELQGIHKKFPQLRLNRWSVRIVRGLMKLMPMPAMAGDVEVRKATARGVETTHGQHDVALRIYRPRGPALQRRRRWGTAEAAVPALLWIHGGGLVIGHARMDDAYVARFVAELGIVVVSVDYRLAPQHPFPAALVDCYAVLTWMQAQAGALGIDPGRIAVGGASAGGGLAASVAQLAHDRAEVDVAFQLLIYPMLDDRSALRRDIAHADVLTLTPANNRFGWESYLQQRAGLDDAPPYAVPARREDLRGLPPAWIGVAALDLLYEEDVAYARRLQRCGVDCELVVVEGAFHGFDIFGNDVPIVQDYRRAQVAALRRGLGCVSYK